MTEDHLLGWLCMARLQWCAETTCHMPSGVVDELVERGWISPPGDQDWEGDGDCGMTEAGWAASDLAAPEWGIDPIGSNC